MAQQILNAVVGGSVLTLFSLGLALSWGTLGVLNLAHGALFVFAGYLAATLSDSTELPFVVLLLIGIVGAGCAALVLEAVAFGRVRQRFGRHQAELAMLVASVGGSIVVNKIVSQGSGYTVFSVSPDTYRTAGVELAGLHLLNIEIYIIVLTLVVVFLVDRWVRRSRGGRAVRSVAYDPVTSGLLGVDVRRLAAGTMFVSGALAGLAGVLVTVRNSGQDVPVGETYLLTAFAILILGGVGNLRGTVVAAYVIALAQTMVVAYGPSNYRDMIAFAVILLVLLFRPQGLFAQQRFERS
ncbi:branched-chain amino acid ABC transporter permease [Micromonospora inositola]|uniref:Amino acid/amide ABC transporter membrane protein 1, HAAT family n=1 Tax=Micromonospora inositola TaxID=47865 RepID=A0A1C5JNF3_9ACTN|nr:branched-chain amino acid ABC transporter permease [Micromonospora inositola]SCG72115.1 amino acid/amide ABC transporter membrane protein 1, HAAT family [Micromonospora inositola]